MRSLFNFSDLPLGTSKEPLDLLEVGFWGFFNADWSSQLDSVSVSAPHPFPSPVPPGGPVTCRPGAPCPSGRVTMQEDLSKVYSAFLGMQVVAMIR